MVDRFKELPRRNRDVHNRLWRTGLLSFEGKLVESCGIADYSARLLSASLQVNRKLGLVFPVGSDFSPAILASVVVAWCFEPESLRGNNRILCISDKAGAQRYLRGSRIGSLDLSQVLNIEAGQRGQREAFAEGAGPLPTVICACRPADPESLVQSVEPDLILIDVAGASNPRWLDSTVAAINKREIPTCAWSNNPLVLKRCDFVDNWLWFAWAAHPPSQSITDAGSLRGLIAVDNPVSLSSVVLAPSSSQFVACLSKATTNLLSCRDIAQAGVGQSCQRLLAGTLRVMARLPVPLLEYETRCRSFWGLPSISDMLREAEQFINYWGNAPEGFLSTASWLREAHSALEHETPPLCDYLVEAAIDGRNLRIAFPSKSLATIFREYVAREFCGSVDSEIAGSWIGPLDSVANDVETRVLLAGIPSLRTMPMLAHSLSSPSTDVVHYSFERGLFRYLVDQVAKDWEVAPQANLHALSQLSGKDEPDTTMGFYQRIVQGQEVGLATSSMAATGTLEFEAPEVLEAWERLLRQSESDESETEIELRQDGVGLVENAIEIRFVGGSSIILAGNDLVQSVRDGRLVEVEAGEMKRGDQMLVVDGSRRQDLYSLVLDRMHSIPGVAVYADLIGRWRSEIATAFRLNWLGTGKSYFDLLLAIRRNGSSITTPETIRNWTRGLHIPQDRLDLRRIAEALNMDFGLAQFHVIYNASNAVSAVHRNVSRQINTWLQWRISDPAKARIAMNSEVSSDYGVSLRDFYDAVLLLDVEAVTLIGPNFPSSQLGFLRANQ